MIAQHVAEGGVLGTVGKRFESLGDGTVLTRTLKALKQSVARRLIAGRKHFWKSRYCDFNVWSSAKLGISLVVVSSV